MSFQFKYISHRRAHTHTHTRSNFSGMCRQNSSIQKVLSSQEVSTPFYHFPPPAALISLQLRFSHSVSTNADEFFAHTQTFSSTAEILRYQSNDLVVGIACQALITICFMAYTIFMRSNACISLYNNSSNNNNDDDKNNNTAADDFFLLMLARCYFRCSCCCCCCSCVHIYSKAEISPHSEQQ